MARTNLTESVAGAHRVANVRDWDRIFVVGDVHGCLAPLERLLDRLAVSPDDLVIFVGDLVRKGPDSQGVVDLVRARENMWSVRGNNEQKVLDGEAEASLDAGARAYLETMPLAIGWDRSLVVHGGVDPERALDEHSRSDLQTMRSPSHDGGYDGPFWFERYAGPPRVFFGHTVLSDPYVTEWAVGLDTGCVYGGALTAIDVTTGELTAVEPKETHRDRQHSKIATPGTGPRANAGE